MTKNDIPIDEKKTTNILRQIIIEEGKNIGSRVFLIQNGEENQENY